MTASGPSPATEAHFRKLERMYAAAPINAWFRPEIRVASGTAEVRIPLRPEFHHAAGATHGSVYFKALDDATFFAANSLVEDAFVLTARFEIELLRPVVAGELRAVARVTEPEGRRIVAEGDLFDGEGHLVGRGRGEFARSKVALEAVASYALAPRPARTPLKQLLLEMPDVGEDRDFERPRDLGRPVRL